jgi:vibriolysin
LAALAPDVDVRLDAAGVPSSLAGLALARSDRDPGRAAVQALESLGPVYRRGRDDGFKVRLTQDDDLGMTHVRMAQTYRGLPVVGGELIVHLDGALVVGVNGRFVPDLDVSIRRELTDAQVAAAAIASVVASGGENAGVTDVGGPVVFLNADNEAHLSNPVRTEYLWQDGVYVDDVYVDAVSGDVAGRRARLYTAKFRQIYAGSTPTPPNCDPLPLPGTPIFQEGGSSTDAIATTAYNGTGTAYDFYKGVFGRDSYDGSGSSLVSTVHFIPMKLSGGGGGGPFKYARSTLAATCANAFSNAAWISGADEMVFGDGDGISYGPFASSLDIVAHELTHGVTEKTAGLEYQDESGALDEATSDILGRSAAFWAGKGNPAIRTDWTIGADVFTPSTPGDALRYMYDPAEDASNQPPPRTPSADFYPTRNYASGCSPLNTNDYCGVHANSGIGNLFFYLLSQGGSHPRQKTSVIVNGVGIVSARQIWYRALTTYMTPTTTFQDARTFTAAAAADLFGGTCSDVWVSVHKAWDAVGVPGSWLCLARPRPKTISFPQGRQPSGTSTTAQLTLDSAAPPGGSTVSLSVTASPSTPSAVTIPASVTVPAGATSASFTVTTGIVSTATLATITATYQGVPISGSFYVDPPVYQGYHDTCDCYGTTGWAWNPNWPTTPVNVDIYVDSGKVGSVLAGGFRQDLLNAGIGNGYHGFGYNLPTWVRAGSHTVTAKYGGTQTNLGTTPKSITCESANIVWIQPQTTAGFGPPGSLIIAGHAQRAPSGTGVYLYWRDVTAGGGWNQVGYAPPPDSTNTWYNSFPANFSHTYSVYIVYDVISTSSTPCTYAGNNTINWCP